MFSNESVQERNGLLECVNHVLPEPFLLVPLWLIQTYLVQCFCTMISSYIQFISISATRSLVKFSKDQLYYMLSNTMTECSLLTHSFVWSFFLSPVRSLSIFFSSLTRSFVRAWFVFLFFVRSFFPSPVRSFLRSCARCLFSYSLVRAWFIRLFSHPFARSRGRTFVVFSLTHSFVRAWLIRLFSHPFARSHGRTFVVPYLARSFVLGSFTPFILGFVCLIVCSLTRLLVLTVVR